MQLQEMTIVHLTGLTIEDLFSLNKSTVESATPVKESIGKLPKAILAQLETNNNAMGVQMNKSLKNALTPQVIEMRAEREDRFAEVKRNVTTALKGRDPGKKAAAENIESFLRPYWNFKDRAMNTQTGVMNELFSKFNASEPLKAQAATLGITDMMTGLETANVAFGVLYQTRNEHEAATNGPSASSLRRDAQTSYEQFCLAIEQAVNYTPTDIYTALFKQMDELRKTYARLATTKAKEPEANQAASE